MPRLIQQAGLEMIRMFPYIMVEVGKGDFWLSGIDAYEKLAPKSGGDDRGRSHQLGQCTACSLRQRCVFRREQLLHLYCKMPRVAAPSFRFLKLEFPRRTLLGSSLNKLAP